MPRGKKTPKRGNAQASRGGGRKPLETAFVPFAGTSTPRQGRAFSLQDEARNTDRHSSFWNTDQRLRDTKVSFVSAGKTEPLKADDTESALADMTLESPPEHSDEDTRVYEQERGEGGKSQAGLGHSAQTPGEEIDEEVLAFVVDTIGSEPVRTGLPPPKLRSASPTPSNSSEEVILFRGRNVSRPPPASRTVLASSAPTDTFDAQIRIVEGMIHEREELLEDVLYQSKPATPDTLQTPVNHADFESLLPKTDNRRARRGRRGGQKTVEHEEEDAMIADYIANMDQDDDVPHQAFNQRELGGTEDEIWQDTEASSGEPSKEPDAAQSGWNRSDIEDFDDLSTSDGVMGEVQAILSKRERGSGPQYLVVWEHQSVDEARWVPAATLGSVGALLHIESFEAEEKLVAEFQDDGDETTSDSDEMVMDVIDDEDSESDDKDLIQRKIDRMSDERIARLLSKQEELGMGSAEILLFDEDEEADEIEDMSFLATSFSPAMLPSKRSRNARGSQRARGDFPSATLLADAYDGFDVMDFERPSLKKKPKGRKGKLVLDDISDSELEASMQTAWDNDRVKKKERKQEREELRSQGLLGNKNDKVDMKQKYKEGMGIHAVKEEIKVFLMGSNTTLALPPMDKADRKVVHELANAFKLKSKSAGDGNKRFPILYRTTRTLGFNNGSFDAVEAKLSRRFLPRMDVSSKRGAGIKRVARGGGFNKAAVSYQDGDIVGGSAPELGAENRGRAMLEKMGWSSGTALGALNNKGILQPVSHVVKTTKAGLG